MDQKFYLFIWKMFSKCENWRVGLLVVYTGDQFSNTIFF